MTSINLFDQLITVRETENTSSISKRFNEILDELLTYQKLKQHPRFKDQVFNETSIFAKRLPLLTAVLQGDDYSNVAVISDLIQIITYCDPTTTLLLDSLSDKLTVKRIKQSRNLLYNYTFQTAPIEQYPLVNTIDNIECIRFLENTTSDSDNPITRFALIVADPNDDVSIMVYIHMMSCVDNTTSGQIADTVQRTFYQGKRWLHFNQLSAHHYLDYPFAILDGRYTISLHDHQLHVYDQQTKTLQTYTLSSAERTQLATCNKLTSDYTQTLAQIVFSHVCSD